MDNVMGRHLDGDRICDLAEGTLDPALRTEAETHLKGCADCRRELEAARGYLREMSALTAIDPIQAPPNFLANVRARLPQPSPLKRLWDGFLRPFRVIPMQVALLTVLGLTAISSYLYQRGGLHESPSIVPMSSTSAASETVASKPEAAPSKVARKKAAVRSKPDRESREGRGSGWGSDKADAAAENNPSRTLERKAVPASGLPEPKERSRPLGAAPGAAPGYAGTGSDAGPGASVGRMAPVPAKPAAPPAPAPAADDGKKSADASKGKASGGKHDAADYEELESISVADEAAISPSGEVRPAAPEQGKAVQSRPKAEASEPKELPGFSLRLDRGKQSADVLAGLKAMGAELLSGPERAKGGEPPGEGYVLRVPASMIKDLTPYLARYGKAERLGVLPAGQSPVRMLLRILPAPK